MDIELQYRVFGRTFAWEGDEDQRAFRNYDLVAASAARLVAEVYPMAFVRDDVLRHLGVTASFGMAFGLDAQDTRGRHYDTTAYDLSAGLRFRLPLSPQLPDIGVSVAWTRQVFYVRASETQALGGVPDLVYDGLRGGVSARIPLVWRVSLRADFGFTWVFSTGELGDVFLPKVSSMAFDGSLAVALRIWRGLEGRIGFDVRDTLHDTHHAEGDRFAATAASDLYLTGTFGLAWRW